jgi:error-prone DNA polymerase
VRARRSLDEIDGWLPVAATAHLRSGGEIPGPVHPLPGAVARAAQLGEELAFDLKLVAPRLPDVEVPDVEVPDGHDDASWLRHLAYAGARRRYGRRDDPQVSGAREQIELAAEQGRGQAGYEDAVALSASLLFMSSLTSP